jgi:hypothetical protein
VVRCYAARIPAALLRERLATRVRLRKKHNSSLCVDQATIWPGIRKSIY